MLPSSLTTVGVSIRSYPSLTFKLTDNEISGTIKGKEAIAQSIQMMLSVPRNKYLIFDSNYGSDLTKIIGKSPDYAKILLKRYVTNCLKTDDRVSDITDWNIIVEKKKMTATFTVITSEGDVTASTEVSL